MSIRAFIQALIRFCNIHGASTHIYSDNERSFKTALGGDRIQHHVESDEFKTYTNSVAKHMEIPLYLPWFGSTWERLIRMIKSDLYKILVWLFSSVDTIIWYSKDSEFQATNIQMLHRSSL